MDLGVVISLVCLAFGGGAWSYRIKTRLDKIDNHITPLVILHKKELIEYYLEKGIMPNPGMTTRKKYLIDKLGVGTLSFSESQELSRVLKIEEKVAREAGNTDALIAILGLIALVAIIATLSQK